MSFVSILSFKFPLEWNKILFLYQITNVIYKRMFNYKWTYLFLMFQISPYLLPIFQLRFYCKGKKILISNMIWKILKITMGYIICKNETKFSRKLDCITCFRLKNMSIKLFNCSGSSYLMWIWKQTMKSVSQNAISKLCIL